MMFKNHSVTGIFKQDKFNKGLLVLLGCASLFLSGCGTGDYEERSKKGRSAVQLASKFVELDGGYSAIQNSGVTIRIPKGVEASFQGGQLSFPAEIPGLSKFKNQSFYYSVDGKYKGKDAGGNDTEHQAKLPVQLTICVIDNENAKKTFIDETKKKYKADWQDERITIAPRKGAEKLAGTTDTCQTTSYEVKGFVGNPKDNDQKEIKGTMSHILVPKDKYKVLISWRIPETTIGDKKFSSDKLLALAKAAAGTIDIEDNANQPKKEEKK